MIAFDTNVLIYACDRNDLPRQKAVLELIDQASDGVLLWQVACEFVAATRKLSNAGFTVVQARERLAELLGFLPLILPTAGVLDRARALQVQQHWSFWDALIVGACLESGVNRLYSEDLPGRDVPKPLEIVNPFA